MSESTLRTRETMGISAKAAVWLFVWMIGGVQLACAAEGVSTAAYVKQVAELVNRERTNHRREELRLDAGLCEAAQKRAAEIAVKYSHTRPDDREFQSALDDEDISYRIAEENIGRSSSQTKPEAIMKVWMDGKAQRDNILKPQFLRLGVGVVAGSRGELYWVQLFTGP
ncbi:MAG: CAP domain-containing protein [Candidatus Accumulibacter sp.]|nr:CAP domain-containing protein [Accumulibacter sp.]